MRWGQSHDGEAGLAYLQFLQETDGSAAVSMSGLVVDVTEPCLACSPDGLVDVPGSTEPHGAVELSVHIQQHKRNSHRMKLDSLLNHFRARSQKMVP